MAELSETEIRRCREAFEKFDRDGSGSIDVWELSLALESSLKVKPTQDEVFAMISLVDEDMSGTIDFAEFLKVIQSQKAAASKVQNEDDLVDAFVAMGGAPDRTGNVDYAKMKKVICEDFGLTIPIDDLLKQIDAFHNEQLDYSDFKKLLS